MIAEYIFFSSIHGTAYGIYSSIHGKTGLNTFKRTKRVQIISQTKTKLEINGKGKFRNS